MSIRLIMKLHNEVIIDCYVDPTMKFTRFKKGDLVKGADIVNVGNKEEVMAASVFRTNLAEQNFTVASVSRSGDAIEIVIVLP